MLVKENINDILKPKNFNNLDVKFGGQSIEYWMDYSNEKFSYITYIDNLKQYIHYGKETWQSEGNIINDNVLHEATMLGASIISIFGRVNTEIIEAYIMQNG